MSRRMAVLIAVLLGVWAVGESLQPKPATVAANTDVAPDPPGIPQKAKGKAAQAKVTDKKADAMDAAAKMIRLAGYDCREVDDVYMTSSIWPEQYRAYCNGFRYTYYITNHGGRWRITTD